MPGMRGMSSRQRTALPAISKTLEPAESQRLGRLMKVGVQRRHPGSQMQSYAGGPDEQPNALLQRFAEDLSFAQEGRDEIL